MKSNVNSANGKHMGIIRYFIVTAAVLCCVELVAQKVPNRLWIGDVELHINENARRQIQQDVDRLTQSETYYNILVDRMNLYFPLIEQEHRKGGVPDEIKFLSIQESALISDAVSSANAVGFWQFKDFTGREVGLRVDRQVDERLNIVAASQGSAKYFNTNNFFFDNWPYAVIAYQAGAGGAKAHTDTKDYGQKKLNVTTKSYWYLKKIHRPCCSIFTRCRTAPTRKESGWQNGRTRGVRPWNKLQMRKMWMWRN